MLVFWCLSPRCHPGVGNTREGLLPGLGGGTRSVPTWSTHPGLVSPHPTLLPTPVTWGSRATHTERAPQNEGISACCQPELQSVWPRICCLSVRPSIRPSVPLSIPPSVHVSTRLSYLYINPPVHKSIHTPPYVLPARPSLPLSVCLSVRLPHPPPSAAPTLTPYTKSVWGVHGKKIPIPAMGPNPVS